ncbi:hypothetical protein IE53DRAFT_368016 [Violaceomyces palustris]|uniref:Uncharacterized protein n=1 Tax=Violaceomyces palustris TaxID=1673888 RepID=A0ACD0P075_9BASI|nr:hypothetical protein IE53DRAFT_368016 [Violaceomyces palustris]
MTIHMNLQGNLAGASTSRPLVPRKHKRVIVTSCDICRLRKLKCNAKELPKGTPCMNCSKHGVACTFEDCKEQHRPAIKMVKPKSSLKRKDTEATRQMKGVKRPLDLDRSLHGLSYTQAFDSMTVSQTHPAHWAQAPNLLPAMPPQHALGNNPSHNFLFQPKQTLSSNWGILKQDLVPPKKRALHGLLPRQAEQNGPWNGWSLPPKVTNPSNGMASNMAPFQLVQLLASRFFSETSFNAFIIPQEEFFERLNINLRAPSTAEAQAWKPLPDYLLYTVLASASTFSSTREPELRIWKQHSWRGAMESIHARMRSNAGPELELIQALLLLGLSWAGEPDCVERTIAFETAFRLAFSFDLCSSKHLNAPSISRREKAKRVVLFWIVYVIDKLVAVSGSRPALIARDMHDIPMITMEDMQLCGLSNLILQAQDVHAVHQQAYWLHCLAVCYIALADILEEVQQGLYPAGGTKNCISLEGVHRRIRPIETKLEEWCKNNRFLLQSASEHGRLCQSVTEAIIAQLHLVQMQLYQPPLRFEYEDANSNKGSSDKHGGSSNPANHLTIQFSPENTKALTACIESAWHLVQQPVGPSYNPATPFTSAAMIASSRSSPAQITSTSFAVTKATQFIKFLSQSWKDWNAGLGMLQYTPRSVPAEGFDEPQQPTNDEILLGSLASNADSVSASFEPSPPEVPSSSAPSIQQFDSTSSSPGPPGQRRESTELEPFTSRQQGGGGTSRRRAAPPPPLNFAASGTKTSSSSGLGKGDINQQIETLACPPPLNTASLRALGMPVTPARFLFDSGSINQVGGESHEQNPASSSNTFAWPGASSAMMTPLRSSFLGSLDFSLDVSSLDNLGFSSMGNSGGLNNMNAGLSNESTDSSWLKNLFPINQQDLDFSSASSSTLDRGLEPSFQAPELISTANSAQPQNSKEVIIKEEPGESLNNPPVVAVATTNPNEELDSAQEVEHPGPASTDLSSSGLDSLWTASTAVTASSLATSLPDERSNYRADLLCPNPSFGSASVSAKSNDLMKTCSSPISSGFHQDEAGHGINNAFRHLISTQAPAKYV